MSLTLAVAVEIAVTVFVEAATVLNPTNLPEYVPREVEGPVVALSAIDAKAEATCESVIAALALNVSPPTV